MREGQVRCFDPHGFHFMRYVEWGDPHNKRVLVCVHGLTRNARDFDYLAERLQDAYRVVSVDVAGRGRSDWLRDPADYHYLVYCSDITTLIAQLGVETVDWIGTSMGGIIGMIMASMEQSPVRKLILNDVGVVVPGAALARIGSYVGMVPEFESIEALEAAMRAISPFGQLTTEQWRHLAVHAAEQGGNGKWRFRYDPGIAHNFRTVGSADVDLRQYWKRVHGPALVIRGDSSDVLLQETLDEMCRRPHTERIIVPNTGHAPMLMDDFQVLAVRRFLLS